MHGFETCEHLIKFAVLIALAALLALIIACICCLTLSSSVHAANWELLSGTGRYGVYTLESDGERLYGGGKEGVYFSLDDGLTWREGDLKRSISAMTVAPDAMYAVTWAHAVYRSDTRGNTWHRIDNGLGTFRHKRAPKRPPPINQILITRSGMLIAVGFSADTYISRDGGDTWHQNPNIGTSAYSIAEFGGYIWVARSDSRAMRSADEGDTWENFPDRGSGSIAEFGRIQDWAVFDNNLYVAGHYGFGRWREEELKWEVLNRGLPKKPCMEHLAIHRRRIFAVVDSWAVAYFDQPSETWEPIGLWHRKVTSLVPHRGELYAATDLGIYRATFPRVQPYNKAAATWGAVKTQ